MDVLYNSHGWVEVAASRHVSPWTATRLAFPAKNLIISIAILTTCENRVRPDMDY